MTIETIKGDLFESQTEALAHGCNLEGVMGAGIAKEFRRRWPDMYTAYRADCHAGVATLGSALIAHTDGPIIFNLITQSKRGPFATLSAIGSALLDMRQQCEHLGIQSVAMPLIGCGIGGLDWKTQVGPLLERLWSNSPIHVVVYSLGEIE